jgi:hypothetical protein
MYHPKHVELFPDINKLCDVATFWIYKYIGILLGARPILHISRIKVKTHMTVPRNFDDPQRSTATASGTFKIDHRKKCRLS